MVNKVVYKTAVPGHDPRLDLWSSRSVVSQ